MQIRELHARFEALQKKFGDEKLNAIYGAGCIDRPDVCFVFMNPTGKNVSADKKWKGLRAPWIGTKNIWKLFRSVGILSAATHGAIQEKIAEEWDENFAANVYQEMKDGKIFISNLAKSTQSDARPLPDSVFREYLPLMREEILRLQPKVIITFGNQVSSILLQRPIRVSETRRTSYPLVIGNESFPVYPVFYPVGQGMRNIDAAIADIRWILKAA